MAELLNKTLKTRIASETNVTVSDKQELNKQSTISHVEIVEYGRTGTWSSNVYLSVKANLNFYDKNNNLIKTQALNEIYLRTTDKKINRSYTINNIDLNKVKYIELVMSGLTKGSWEAYYQCTVYYEESQASEIIKDSVIETIKNHELIQYVVPYKENEEA